MTILSITNKRVTTTTLFVVLSLYLSGCAQLSVTPSHDSALTHCDNLFTALDEAVAQQGVREVQDRRMSVAPYLRVNRFLASFRDEVSGAAFEQWLDAMQGLAISGWEIEYGNLTEQTQQSLWRQAQTASPVSVSFKQALTDCAGYVRDIDFSSDAAQQAIRQAAVVEDNYSLLKRVLGVYPVTALAFRKGISDWHEETRRRFSLATNQLPIEGELLTYMAANEKRLKRTEAADILHQSSANSLQIPMPVEAQLDALFSIYAPIYEIDTRTRDDRIGMPSWGDDKQIHIDTHSPVVYRYPSYTRYQQHTLLQLNYVIWFPARTAKSKLDLLAGKLDGITWRVTLLPDGEPLVFDSIHNCGCYHLFFAGENVSPQPGGGFSEPAFFPSKAAFSYTDLPLVLRISSGTHYIDQVYSRSKIPPSVLRYSMHSADTLRSLPYSSQQHRSLYNQDGLISGSERLERFLFWPMGTSSAGTMRQPGHHATAFVGRRHFDNARLFETLLQIGGT